VVLIISRNQYCDKPLEMILIVYILRLILSIYRRRPSPPQNTQTNLEMGATTQQQRHYPSSAQPHTQANAPQRTARHNTLAGWIDRAKSALDLFSILWFIIMNWLLFSSSTCSSTAPSLYYLTLIFIVFGYIIITIPIILCAAVIFCLPCVLGKFHFFPA
jgi:small-conductance mechanosensitive channel